MEWLGGEEFAVIASGQDRATMRSILERLLVQARALDGHDAVGFSFSTGSAQIQPGGTCRGCDAMRRADAAHYVVKRRGEAGLMGSTPA